MKYQPFENDLSEICSKEEIEEFMAMCKAFKSNPTAVLDGLNARKLTEFYVKASICAKYYNLEQTRYKSENIDGKKEIEPEVKAEYERLYERARYYLSLRRMIEQVGRTHNLGKYTLGGKSVIQTAEEIAKLSLTNEEGKRNKNKIEYLLEYIDLSDKAMGLYEESYGE